MGQLAGATALAIVSLLLITRGVQVQFGPSKVSKKSSRIVSGREQAGSFACVLMQTETDFTLAELRAAFAASFDALKTVRLCKRGLFSPFCHRGVIGL